MNHRTCLLLLLAVFTAARASGVEEDGPTEGPSIFMGGSIEIEHERERRLFPGAGSDETSRDTTGTVQFEIEALSTSDAGAHIVLEVDTDEENASVVDEAYLFLERDAYEATAGRVYVPIGRFDSLFGTDSFTEFGEIRATSLVLGVRPAESVEAGLFFIDGRIDAGGTDDVDYGATLEFSSPDESWRLGAGYVSDIAEARDLPFEIEARRTARRVAGWNVFAGVVLGDLELFLESVSTDGRFREQGSAFDEPAATTFELIYRPSGRSAFATRVETSREIEDAPRRRYGISARWYATEYVEIGLDLLTGRFRKAPESDDDDDAPADVREALLQIVLEY